MKKYILLAFFSFMISNSAIFAAEKVTQFKDGDRVCFIGDSITHGGMYHSYIYLYYLSRFPNQKINFYNCGISGDTASGTVMRFDKDIKFHKPTVSTIMLGMNDVGRTLYNSDKNGDAVNKKREKRLNVHFTKMDQLAKKLKEINSKIIFITPSIYDQTAKLARGRKNQFGVNDALGKCAEKVKQMAKQYNAEVIDFYEFMKKINKEHQNTDPTFTIIGRDRVHPGRVGHFLMAYQFLKSQNVPKYVSLIEIDVSSKKIVKTVNCKSKNLKIADNKITFSLLENALPYPVGKAAAALKLVPFTQEMNQEIVKINNLPKGKYNLKIDTVNVGEYSDTELSMGINLAENGKTPQYNQALKLMELNKQRLTLTLPLRTIAWVEYKTLNNYKGDLNDIEAIKVVFSKKLEQVKGRPYAKYYEIKYKDYLAKKPNQNKYLAELKIIQNKLYQENQPSWHHYEIIKVGK